MFPVYEQRRRAPGGAARFIKPNLFGGEVEKGGGGPLGGQTCVCLFQTDLLTFHPVSSVSESS